MTVSCERVCAVPSSYTPAVYEVEEDRGRGEEGEKGDVAGSLPTNRVISTAAGREPALTTDTARIVPREEDVVQFRVGARAIYSTTKVNSAHPGVYPRARARARVTIFNRRLNILALIATI